MEHRRGEGRVKNGNTGRFQRYQTTEQIINTISNHFLFYLFAKTSPELTTVRRH